LDTGTELHAAVGLHGAIYCYSVDSVSVIKDGGQGIPFDTRQMTSPSVNITYLKGLAMPATSEGPYAAQYVVSQDNQTMYRSRWGLEGEPGALVWAQINGAWATSTTADICEASRTDGSQNAAIWTTAGTKVYHYPSCFWGAPADLSFDLGTALNGVALGDPGILWVLTADRRVMEVDSLGGSILRQFAVSSDISQPSGIEYDEAAGSLWIGNLADNCIYQVSLGTVARLAGDANTDGKVDVSDLGILAANYGVTSNAVWSMGDFNEDGKVDVSDLGILAANYGTGTGSTLDFNRDAAALGLKLTDDPAKEEASPAAACPLAGLPLLAGFLLAGVALSVSGRLEE
jgi:hypothetical protein